MIEAQNVTFEYIRRDEDGNVSEIVEAVKNLSLQIQPGEFVGVLGRNGSGKSTFAKMLVWFFKIRIIRLLEPWSKRMLHLDLRIWG